MKIFYVGVGGAIGAMLRVFISEAVPLTTPFPFATLGVNLFGSLLLGFLLTTTTAIRNSDIKLMLTTGILGAFTTFSTFSYETLQLLQEGMVGYALLYVSTSIVGGLLCSASGVWMARRFSVCYS